MRIGVIGTGWGLMHVGAFRAAGAEVTALAGRDADKTRRIAEREGVPLATTDVAHLIRSVDAVVVASPDAAHRAHVEQALAAGRHVLVEKPITRTAADAQDLVRLAAAAPDLVTAVNFPYRMLPPVAGLHGWLSSREPIRRGVVTIRNGFAGAEGFSADGPMMGQSGDFGGVSHPLDAALWLMGGRPVWVEADLAGRPVHSALLHIGLSTGGVLSLNHLAAPEPGIHGGWSFIGPDNRWEVGFEGGYHPQLSGWLIGPVRAFDGTAWFDVGPLAQPYDGPREPWSQAHVATATAFLRTIAGGDRAALADFTAGATVQQVLDAAMRATAEGRRILL